MQESAARGNEGALARGREAIARGAWEEALDRLRPYDGDPDALELMGTAAWWLDDADQTIAVRERAYRLFRSRGDMRGAARVAGALAWDSILFGGRPAVAHHGWLQRRTRLLSREPLCPEHGWLVVREAEVSLELGEVASARAASVRAIEIGRELGREDLQLVGLALEGLGRVHGGDVAAGLRQLDEVAAAATGGEIDDPMWIGKVCCYLIDACAGIGDLERAGQWCDEVKAFARRWELRTLFSVCRTQYAGVLIHRGGWGEAGARGDARRVHREPPPIRRRGDRAPR